MKSMLVLLALALLLMPTLASNDDDMINAIDLSLEAGRALSLASSNEFRYHNGLIEKDLYLETSAACKKAFDEFNKMLRENFNSTVYNKYKLDENDIIYVTFETSTST